MALSEKKKITNDRYLSKFKTFLLRLIPEEYDAVQSAAAAAGESLQGYILQAVRERMEKDAKK